MEKQIQVTRIFNAPVAMVWSLWVDPELVKKWWGPRHFTAPTALIDFRVGGKSVVSMMAPAEMGNRVFYNTWEYLKIDLFERIEFLQSLSDPNGTTVDPVTLGMPPDFPKEFVTIITFRQVDPSTTEMTVTQHADMGAMSHFAQLGLEQSLDKMPFILG